MSKKTKNTKSNAKNAGAAPTVAATVQPTAGSVARPNTVCLEFTSSTAKRVCVAGSFNQWQPEETPLKPVGNGRWVGNLSITPGRYEYLFVADGEWQPDPNATESVQNPFGGTNSVLVISQ